MKQGSSRSPTASCGRRTSDSTEHRRRTCVREAPPKSGSRPTAAASARRRACSSRPSRAAAAARCASAIGRRRRARRSTSRCDGEGAAPRSQVGRAAIRSMETEPSSRSVVVDADDVARRPRQWRHPFRDRRRAPSAFRSNEVFTSKRRWDGVDVGGARFVPGSARLAACWGVPGSARCGGARLVD